MNDKAGCIFSQDFIFRIGNPQHCETLNLGPHTLGKCFTTVLYPQPLLKYICTFYPNSQLWPTPFQVMDIPGSQSKKEYRRQVQQSLQAARLIGSPDVNSGLSSASLPTATFSL